MTNYRRKLKIGTYTNFRSADLKIELTKTENLQMEVKKKKKKKSCKVIRSSWKLVPTLNLGRRIRKSRASKLKTLQWKWRRRKRRKVVKLSDQAENWHRVKIWEGESENWGLQNWKPFNESEEEEKEEKKTKYRWKLKIGDQANFRPANLKIEFSKIENLLMKVKKKKKK